ncbi:MAG: replication protein A [Archaeoglobaceae archaeon]
MKRIEELADRIYETFKDYGVKKKEILERLKLLIIEFKVPEDEAYNTVVNYLVREYKIPREELRAPLTKIAEVLDSEPGRWVSVKAKVVQLWEPTSPSITQTGLIGDETGLVRFLIWAKSGKPEVEEGKCYVFRNVVIDEFAGIKRLNVTRYSEIEEIDEEIVVAEVGGEEKGIVGALVAIHQNSGLIQRCSECNRVAKGGHCPVHGKVKTYDDLRVRGVLDDGRNTYEIIMGEDVLKELLGIDLAKAKRMAQESLDRGVVLEELRKQLLGKYLVVDGVMGPRFLRVTRAEFYRPKIKEEIDKLLEELA